MYNLTEEQIAIVETAKEVADKKIKPVREHYDEKEEFPWPIVEELRKADLFSVYFPTKYGGMGGGGFELCLAVEQLSRACGGIALTVACCGLGSFPILIFGNEKQKMKYLPDIASGKRLAAFALTEPEAGSDATAMTCKAKREGDYYVLNGTKNFCSNGEVAEIYSIFATTNKARGARGVTAFIVEKGTPGFTFGKKEKKMGIRASPTYELHFDNCKVPAENVIFGEGKGLFVAQGTFDLSRPGVASQALGIAQGAFDEATKYAHIRKQFGQTALSFPTSQHMAADMATAIEAGRALLYTVARDMDKILLAAEVACETSGKTIYEEMKNISKRRWTKETAMVKLYCSDMAMKVTTDCVQLAGGIGYMRDFPVEKFMRDAKITQIYEGTNQIQRNEIGYALIKELSQAQ